MNKEQCKTVVSVMGNLAKKVIESATHAAVFAFVSRKVSNLMEKYEKENAKKNKEKVRIENADTPDNVSRT